VAGENQKFWCGNCHTVPSCRPATGSTDNVQFNPSIQSNVLCTTDFSDELSFDLLCETETLTTYDTAEAELPRVSYTFDPVAEEDNDFVEPIYFDNFADLLTTDNDKQRQSIVWIFASTLPCTSILTPMKIQLLYTYLKDKTLEESISFFFRKMSENEEYIQMVPDSMWISFATLVNNQELNEWARISIVYTMSNIVNSRKQISNRIQQQLENLVTSDSISNNLFLATINALNMIANVGISLNEKTLNKLQEVAANDDNTMIQCMYEPLDFLNDTQDLSNAAHRLSISNVKSEYTTTQSTFVSHSTEKVIEPSTEFISVDHLFDKACHFDQTFDIECEPNDIFIEGNHQAWYRSTVRELRSLVLVAKEGNLGQKDYDYLLSKFKNGWHWLTWNSRESSYKTIASIIRNSAKAGQEIPADVIEEMIDRLTNGTKELRKICAECLLIVAQNKQLFEPNQIMKIEDTLRKPNHTIVIRHLMEICALYVSKGYQSNVDLDVIERNLQNETTCHAASYLFFKAAAIEKRPLSSQQMCTLINVAKSNSYRAKVREQCLWTLAYSIETMNNKQSISFEFIKSLELLLKDEIENIRNSAAVALCNYANDDNCQYLVHTLESLAIVLLNRDHNLLHNVSSVYLKWAKQKHPVPRTALDNLSHLIYHTDFSLREKAIWILKYTIINRQNSTSIILDGIIHSLHDVELSIRNTAAIIFVEYWRQKLEENDKINDILLNRMDNLHLIFYNRFQLEVQKSALDLLRIFVDKHNILSEILLKLVEYLLNHREISITTNAIAILASYSQRNCLPKRTVICLERLLTTDTTILPNIISILKTIIGKDHILSVKSINTLGDLLVKVKDPSNIIELLTLADRYRPLPKNVRELLDLNYYVKVLRNSTIQVTLDKAYAGLVSATNSGKQLPTSVLCSLFILLTSSKNQHLLLPIIVNVTSNEQHITNEHIRILSEIVDLSRVPSIDLMRIFAQLTRENQTIPSSVIGILKNFLSDKTINIYIIEIYQYLIQRQKPIEQLDIRQVLNLFDFTEISTDNIQLHSTIAAFFRAVAENQPTEADQTYLLSLLEFSHIGSIRKDACAAAKALAKYGQHLTPLILQTLARLLNDDDNIDIQQIVLRTFEIVRSNNQILDDSVEDLFALFHCRNTMNNAKLLKILEKQVHSNHRLRDEHLVRLSQMLFSCDINLKMKAAIILVNATSNEQSITDKIFTAVYAVLLDETVNFIVIELLLFVSSQIFPRFVMDNLSHLANHSSHPIVQAIARQILRTDNDTPLTLLDQDNQIKTLILSKNNQKISTGLDMVHEIIVNKKQISTDLLLIITSVVASHEDKATKILIAALNQGIKFEHVVCETIEESFCKCKTVPMSILIRMLAEKKIDLQSKTITVLVELLNDQTAEHIILKNAFIALECAARYQILPKEVLSYFANQLANESKDIIQRSFSAIRHQVLKGHVENSTELFVNLQLPEGIDYIKLSQLKTAEQCLGTIQSLLSVNYFDHTILSLPAQQWSRGCLCVQLIQSCSSNTTNHIIAFYHQLTLLEHLKQYGSFYNNERDNILYALIEKQQTYSLDLSIINQILIYLNTSTDVSIEILQSNESNWLQDLRQYFIRDKLNEYVANFSYSDRVFDHFVHRIADQDELSAELIEPFLQMIRDPENIITLLDMITEYEITKHELMNLFANVHADFNAMLNTLQLIILTRTLTSHWTAFPDQVALGRVYLKNLIENGWTIAQLNSILSKMQANVKSHENLQRFLESLTILIEFKLNESIAPRLNEIFSNCHIEIWPTKVHDLIIETFFGNTNPEKNLTTLLAEIQQINKIDISDRLTQMMHEINEAFSSDSSIVRQKYAINKWTIADIKLWAKHVYDLQSEEFVRSKLPEIIAVVKRAIYLDSSFEPRSIQILSLLFILESKHNSGRLLQILTGEGKSIVVAMLAVIKALQGKYVDIITSSIVLAKRDANERRNFYDIFNLTVSHNNDETNYVTGVKSCYMATIVYGTSKQFQFDILRHEFSLLNTRDNRRFDVIIIDEVDSMLIDENNTIARLADQLPGADALNPLLYGIWRCVNMEPEPLEKRDWIIEQFINFIKNSDSPLKIARHLYDLVLDSIPTWVNHAIRAKLEYRLDHHYIIKEDEMHTKRIMPIDYGNTGVVQCNTTLSDGLQQFLQIKHGLEMASLTVTTNYLSNVGFFTRYEKSIYGFTGTLGSTDAQELLCKIYNVDTIIIPSFKNKYHIQMPTVLTLHRNQWLDNIVSTTRNRVNRNQAVLIICETRLDAKTIAKHIRRAYPTSMIRLYSDNTDAIESSVIADVIKQGEIIVATNLAGRGMDFKVSQEVEKNGGLHVCLTFLPTNLRVEEQALGRTSRQGKRGTSQMILEQTSTIHRLKAFYPQFINENTDKFVSLVDVIRKWRDKVESVHLNQILNEELPEIKLKDELFRRFCELLCQLRKQNNDMYRLLSVKERWGLWLKSMDHAVQHRYLLKKLVENEGFQCIDVPRDGDSLFHAVAQQISGKLTTAAIKTRVSKYIIKNNEVYNKLDDENRHWITSRALNMNIVLFRSDSNRPFVYMCQNAEDTCFIGYEVNTHYLPLEPLNFVNNWKNIYLDNIDSDYYMIYESTLKTNNPFNKLEGGEEEVTCALTMKTVDLNMHTNFQVFQNQILNEYTTDKIFENPCYPILEAEDIIVKLSSCNFHTSKCSMIDKAINRLERAVQLDPIFAFNASVNLAYLTIEEYKSLSTYKFKAKSYLIDAQEQITHYILPQLYSIQIELNRDDSQLIFDDFTKQNQNKIETLQLYQHQIEQAIVAIEKAQKLIDVYSKYNQIVNIGQKLDRDKAKDFVKIHNNIIELNFHNLTIANSFWKYHEAIEILDLLPNNYHDVSIHFMDMNSEITKEVISKAKISVVYLTIQYLDDIEVNAIIEEELVDLTFSSSSIEQYLCAVQVFTGNVILNMELKQQRLSSREAVEYIKTEGKYLKTISFESIDKKTASTIVASVKQVAFSLTFNRLETIRMLEIIKNHSKPFSFQFRHLTKAEASTIIEDIPQQNFVLGLSELSADYAIEILNKFNRHEQDVAARLKSISEHYAAIGEYQRELDAYRTRDITHFILINELNPRPWVNSCVICSLGVGQMVAGVYLAATTCSVNLGITLINEGINDIYFAVRGAIIRKISWKDYAIQKGVSLSICFASLGFSTVRQAAQTAHNGTQTTRLFVEQTVQQTKKMMKNSFRTLTNGFIQGTAKTSWNLACQQVAVTCVHTGIREVANYATDSALGNVLSPLRSHIYDEIEHIVNAEYDQIEYVRILTRAVTADMYYENNRYRQSIEQIAMKLLTKEINESVEILKSLGKGISNAFLAQAECLCKTLPKITNAQYASAYMNIGQTCLSWIPSLKGSYELYTITDKFFSTFKKELILLEQNIPTFKDILIHTSNQSLSSQSIAEICRLLAKHAILSPDENGNISFITSQNMDFIADQSFDICQRGNEFNRNFKDELFRNVEQIQFTDEKHKTYVLEVLNKTMRINRKMLDTRILQKKIIELLTNQMLAIIHGTMIAPLTSYVIQNSIYKLSTEIQLALDPNGTVSEKLQQEGAQRYINILSNDFVQYTQNGKSQLTPEDIANLQKLVENYEENKSAPLDFPQQLALSILNGKQGGVIELAIIAALIGKPISVVQQGVTNESTQDKEAIRIKYVEPCVDSKTGNLVDGHYEVDGGSTANSGGSNCLYAAILRQTSGTCKEVNKMRVKCAAFILANPEYITGIQPAVSIICASRTEFRRKQLMMEGGLLQQSDAEEKIRLFNSGKFFVFGKDGKMIRLGTYMYI